MEELKNYFEVKYKEYKDYESFVKSKAEEIRNGRKQLEEFIQSNPDDIEEISQKVFEVETITEFYKSDLVNLQRSLIETYKAVSLVIEFPEEIKEEIASFFDPKQIYVIKANSAVEVDPEHNKRLKEEAKKQFKNIYKNLIKNE
jgi:hypothetical protein